MNKYHNYVFNPIRLFNSTKSHKRKKSDKSLMSSNYCRHKLNSSRPKTSKKAQSKINITSLKDFLERNKKNMKRLFNNVSKNDYIPMTFAKRLKLYKNSSLSTYSKKHNVEHRIRNTTQQTDHKLMSVINLQINNFWNISLIPKKNLRNNYKRTRRSNKSNIHSIGNKTIPNNFSIISIQDSPSNINCKGTRLHMFNTNYPRNVHSHQVAHRSNLSKEKLPSSVCQV